MDNKFSSDLANEMYSLVKVIDIDLADDLEEEDFEEMTIGTSFEDVYSQYGFEWDGENTYFELVCELDDNRSIFMLEKGWR